MILRVGIESIGPTAFGGCTKMIAEGGDSRFSGLDMPSCDEFHRLYDRVANAEVQVAELPANMHVKGRVAWYVAQGPYSELGEMWQAFMKKVRAAKVPVMGPPGDVYVCDPEEHKGSESTLLTIMWAPMKRLPGENR